MKEYTRPVAQTLDEMSEGIFAASGDADNAEQNIVANADKKTCKYGRTEANPGSDSCQGCSASNGAHNNGDGLYRADFKGCPEGFPVKNN